MNKQITQNQNSSQAFKIITHKNPYDRLHTHDKNELVFCAKGKGFQCFENKNIKISIGDFFWIPKSIPHTASATNQSNPTLYIVEINEKSFSRNIYEDAQTLRAIKEINAFASSNNYQIRLSQQNTKNVRKTIEDIINENNNKQACWQIKTKSLLSILIATIIRQHSIFIKSDQSENPSKERIHDICHYIKNHLHQSMTIESVAKMTNFSKSHFHVLFKQTTNMTFIQFLNKERIKKAEELMQTTKLPLENIIQQCGFKSKSQFYISLKKYSGKTPKQFRVLVTHDTKNTKT
jgi:AraC-like DNA-binding protein